MYPDINKKEKSKQEMRADIILSGVGGQGILSIAAVIGEAALKEGLYMKQAEVHGMSQRGGDVQSRYFFIGFILFFGQHRNRLSGLSGSSQPLLPLYDRRYDGYHLLFYYTQFQ